MAFDSPGRRLVGIAKLAAGSETLASKNRVEYFELSTRRYITRCRSGRVPFQWTVNPYRGCEFGCKYCYARYTHEFMELRDIAVLRRIAESNVLHVAVSITTPDVARARLLEPYAPRPDLRMKAVEALSGAGLRVAVLACPLLPLINDDEDGLQRLAEQAARAGAGAFSGGVVFLKPCTHGTMFPFLEEHFPHLVAKYRNYFERKAFVGEVYRQKIAERLERVRQRSGLAARMADGPPAGWAEEAQMSFGFVGHELEQGYSAERGSAVQFQHS